MFTKEQISAAKRLEPAAFRVSCLGDAMTLAQVMSQLCISTITLKEDTHYDGHQARNIVQVESLRVDREALTALGGFSYVQQVLADEFHVECTDDESLDDVVDYLESPDFFQENPIRDLDLDFKHLQEFTLSYDTGVVSIQCIQKAIEGVVTRDLFELGQGLLNP